MKGVTVLYNDESCVVCIKPAGVTAEDGERSGLPTLLAENGQKPLVVHRLDREVSGVMVLAKDRQTAGLISKQITERTFQKEYLAVVEGEVDEYGVLEDLLYHDRVRNKTYTVKRERKGVKPAKLEFWRLGAVKTADTVLSLVRIKLHTGRTHQIRVQFASRGHSLAGDRKYGSRLTSEPALFSRLIGFNDKSGQLKIFTAKPPNSYPWTEFQGELVEI